MAGNPAARAQELGSEHAVQEAPIMWSESPCLAGTGCTRITWLIQTAMGLNYTLHSVNRHLGSIFTILQSGKEGMTASYSTFNYLSNLFKVVQHYINTTSV